MYLIAVGTTIALLLCISLCIAAYLAESFFYTIIARHAPYVPVPQRIISSIVHVLNMRQGAIVYDLGCGDARVLAACYAQQPLATYRGIEIAFFPFILALVRLQKIKKPHTITIQRTNFFNSDVSDATHIFVYLFPEIMDELLPKFQKECAPGTRIVSCDFQFQQKKPIEVVDLFRPAHVRGRYLYVYEI